MYNFIKNLKEKEINILKSKYQNRFITKDEALNYKKKLDIEYEKLDQQAQIYEKTIENISKSEKYRRDIALGIKEGKTDKELLMLAFKCIESMTGEGLFYDRYEQQKEG